jgi:hypothetical protein
MSSAPQLKHQKENQIIYGSPTGVRLELLGAVKRGINAATNLAKELRLYPRAYLPNRRAAHQGGMAEEGRRKIRPHSSTDAPV